MKKLNSSIIYFVFVMAVMALICARGAFGQSCSITNPCVSVQITDTNPVITGDTATLYSCMGGSTSCSAAALAALIKSPGTPSVWHVTAPFPQKAATVTYNDPEPYGALMNYAALNTNAGGIAGPVSGIVVFPVPQASQTAPSLIVGPGVVTSGTAGPQ